MRRALVIAAVCAGLLAGCGADATTIPLTDVDLTELVTILPTPQGLDQSSDVRTAGAAEVQEIFAGRTIPGDARGEFERLGFKEAAVRDWQGPDGRSVVVIASRWPDHFTAINVGAGAIQVQSGGDGATGWTPETLPGVRGVRVTGDGPALRVLSFAIEDISLVVRADGPVSEPALVRTLEFLVTRLRAASRTA